MSKNRKSAYGGPLEEKEVVVSVDKRLLSGIGLLVVFGIAVALGVYLNTPQAGPTQVAASDPAQDVGNPQLPSETDIRATMDADDLPDSAVIITPMIRGTVDPNDPFAQNRGTPSVPENAPDWQERDPNAAPQATPYDPLGSGGPTVELPDDRPAAQWEPDVLAEFCDANLSEEYQPARVELVEGTLEGPRLAISELNECFTYNFGDIPDDETARHMFTAKNVGDEELIIGRVYTGCGCTATTIGDQTIKPDGYLPEPLVLAPGETVEFGVEFDPRAETSQNIHVSQAKYIQIFSNDPTGPQYTAGEELSHETRFRIVVRPQPF